MPELLTCGFASYFENKTLEELDELASSFKIEKFLKGNELNGILQDDAGPEVQTARREIFDTS